MKNTDKTLNEQMRITDFEVSGRKELFSIAADDAKALKNAKPYIEAELGGLVDDFYELQTAVPDIALLIGDSDTLNRLRNAQRMYILDLFEGYYDIEYVNNRLRIGLVHKRIGVEPKLYLAAIHLLDQLLTELIKKSVPDEEEHSAIIRALEKLIMFDISLVFDTYIRSLVSEIEVSRDKIEKHARALEDKVKKRTEQLEKMSRTDALTGLLNRQHFDESLTRSLRAAQRRNEPVTLVYIDINDFKIINDSQGHSQGDKILQNVANAFKAVSRSEDLCFRYGGDEFCIVMPNCGKHDAQEAWEKRVVQILDQQENSPKLSIGYAQTGPNDYISAQQLIQQADSEMYAAKKRKKSE
ncbi:MAG: GGDEF domain-containing protein [Candidatus Thiodiazotropha sp.]|jgi:diguanylate cyclase (GGDEF)-like protein